MIKETLFPEFERELRLDQLGDVLQKLEKNINFNKISQKIDAAAPRHATTGRPPFPTELMVRVLTIQHLFNLSDDQLEFQLLDRLSFQRFVGLRRSSQIPDSKTIWFFRERLITAGAEKVIFEAVIQQLNAQGFIARNGQMIDASLVEAPRQKISKTEKEVIKKGGIPEDWNEAKIKQKDIDASWVTKRQRHYFGYKLTVNVDNRYKFIRSIMVSSASPHDTHFMESVIDYNTSQDIYADSGYTDSKREERLSQKGYRVHILRKATKNKPLSEKQKKRNTRIAKVRARVEHPFAALTQMGGKTVRSIGLARVKLGLYCKVACYNMKRLCSLKTATIIPF